MRTTDERPTAGPTAWQGAVAQRSTTAALTTSAGAGTRQTAPAVRRHHVHRAGPATGAAAARRPGGAATAAALTARLLRRGTAAIALAAAAYVAIEGITFRVAYPEASDRATLLEWSRNQSIRLISGPGAGVDTVGGFTVWDAGWMIELVAAAWAITTTARVLRADERTGRHDPVLAQPLRPVQLLGAQLGVLLGACVLIGLAATAAFVAVGGQLTGSVLMGGLLALFAGTAVLLTAVTSQLFGSRGGAGGVAAAVIGIALPLRVASNSAPSRAWLGWLTPFGWTDHLAPFGANRVAVLAVPLVVVAVLGTLAVRLRLRRDTGAGLLVRHRADRSRHWGLSSPVALATRTGLGSLLAWAGALVVWLGMFGSLVPTVTGFLDQDPSYQQLLSAMGMAPGDYVRGFVGMVGTIAGVAVAAQVAFRVGAARAEEAAGRLDLLLAAPLPRWRWLAGHVVVLVVGAVGLVAVAGAAFWVGATSAGAHVTVPDAVVSALNPLPVVLLFAGLDVLLLGVAPRLVVPVGTGVAVAAYLVQTLGPLLTWPDWVLNLSPFHHLATVPIADVAWPAAWVMTGIAVALAAAGAAALWRRDLVGA
ncbi:hypothetical protein [Cellulomonas sp. T2.31MG-18]|uniref:hypothetical protein n=1 Tax=Cellulomonas sp. T2.31MG-18 TaxID=3157619 RepID=UPI00366C2687